MPIAMPGAVANPVGRIRGRNVACANVRRHLAQGGNFAVGLIPILSCNAFTFLVVDFQRRAGGQENARCDDGFYKMFHVVTRISVATVQPSIGTKQLTMHFPSVMQHLQRG